ncbi:MAG: SDR family NAD(P)-dependent oxidoreductase, partial [Candidatus Hydrogenedentes bacterium]|nr:SDR family NAD(P)-dependent oxidoreductase [Candidatus Hydrogenedentota bacterium]
ALAREGARLILCDIHAERLALAEQEFASGNLVLAAQVDVADAAAMAAFAGQVPAQVPAVDILVNNAGVGMAGSFLDVTLEDWEWILGINLRGVIHGCHYFVPKMVARGGGGHVVNLSSMLGYWKAPDVIAYTTMKHAVFGLSESLREDLRPHGIGVSTICPGIIHTNIVQATRFLGGQIRPDVREHVESVYRSRDYGPEKVAQAIVQAIHRNRKIVPVSPEAWGAYYLERMWPGASRAMARFVAGRIRG